MCGSAGLRGRKIDDRALARDRLAAKCLGNENLLIVGMPRRGSFRRTRTAGPRDAADGASARHFLKMRPDELPGAHVLRLFLHPHDFPGLGERVDRRSEETIGTQLRSLVPKGERVHVATSDYGYFAITAAFGRPSDTIIDRTHDPRIKDEPTLLADHWSAPERLSSENARWLVAPTGIVFPMTLRHRTRDGHLAVYELVPTP